MFLIYVPSPELMLMLFFNLWAAISLFRIYSPDKRIMWLLYFPWIFLFATFLIISTATNGLAFVFLWIAQQLEKVIPMK